MNRIISAMIIASALVNMATADEPHHWAFRKPADVNVPDPVASSQAETPIDRFLNNPVVPPTERQLLIRRVTFDLIGLPPTVPEVETFVTDASPNAYERVLDRLLASPAYGERWGRHWLDVARYADSNGLDENIAHGNAWRYRDYVIQSLNADKPYDQFLTEQLAGDLLPTDDRATWHQRLIATGFLSLGPKVLAEVDEGKMEMDIVDEQIDTVGRALMGLTLGCARCHDHKFDPISHADYYALVGIFKSTRTMEHFRKIARWHENPIPSEADLARKAEHDAQLAELKADIERLKKEVATGEELKRREEELKKLDTAAPIMPSAMGATEGEPTDVAIHLRGDHLDLGEVVTRQVPRVLAGSGDPTFPKDASGRLELARWLTQPDHPLTSRVMVNRIWRWHFGTGLVSSTDNFGKLGTKPTHPELLDWLATRFVRDGWSIKEHHRLILLSSAYRDRPLVRRLEAEEIRDAVHAVAGTLDRTMGGSLLHVGNREFLFDHTSKDETRYDSTRRAVYLPVIRNHLHDMFELFDCTDAAVPNGDRVTTTVAPQALFLMNSELILNASAALGSALNSRVDLDDAGRVRELYRRALAREPSEVEVRQSLKLVHEVSSELDGNRERAWACLCQVVFASSEFVYVR